MAGHETRFRTPQEEFWAGQFGSEYVLRNQEEVWMARNLALLVRALARTEGIEFCTEFGANIALNLRALCNWFPQAELSAIEINRHAVSILRRWMDEAGGGQIHEISLLDYEPFCSRRPSSHQRCPYSNRASTSG